MLCASLAVVLGVALLSYRSSKAMSLAQNQRDLTQNIVRGNAALLSTLKDAETGQRGFLLTGEIRYLEPYTDAVAALPQLLQRLESATAPRSEQNRRLQRIRQLVDEKRAELKATIDLRQAGRPADALAIVETDKGKAYMDEIRALCAAIEQNEQSRLLQAEAAAQQSATNLRDISVGGSVLLAAFLLLSTVTVFRGMARRDELFRQTYASEKLLSTTLAGIADGVIATDAQCRITFINPVAQTLTGWSESDAVGAHIRLVFHIVNETTRLKVDNPLEKALREGVAVGLANHTNLISKSGQDTPIDDSAAPLKDDQGNIVGAVIVFRDITARRQAERELRNANQELQQFVDSAAHDLRSPLGSVNVMAQMLAREYSRELGPKGQQLILEISGSLERMRNLLNDLLAFARASHFDKTTAEPLSLSGPLQSALENLKSEVESSGADVAWQRLPVAAMHEAHAIQLFQNLIGNSIRYRGPQPPRISITAEQLGAEWVISVKDNGIGIEPQFAGEIFKPFKRLHGSEYPGSGIGLATCQKIVKGYGGRIWVESSAAIGATFHFSVPAVDKEVAFGISAAS